jgi:hypothetical protein
MEPIKEVSGLPFGGCLILVIAPCKKKEVSFLLMQILE